MASKKYYSNFIDPKIKKYYIDNNFKFSDFNYTNLKGHFELDSGVSDPRIRTDMYNDLIDLRKTIQTKFPGGDFIISSAKRNAKNASGHNFGLGVDIKPKGKITWTQLYDTIYSDYKDKFHPVLHNNMTPGGKNVIIYDPSKFNHPYSAKSDKVHIDLKYKLYDNKRFLKKYNADISNKLKTSNSPGYQEGVKQDESPLVTYQAIKSKHKIGFMDFLRTSLDIATAAVDIISMTGGIKLHTTSTHAQIAHSGGKIPGRSEVVALLQGGETVRTEGQEKALQEELNKKDKTAAIDNSNHTAHKEAQKQLLMKELLATRDMQDHIIKTVAEAFKYNQYGFRKLLRQY